jgi:hypothetical protein
MMRKTLYAAVLILALSSGAIALTPCSTGTLAFYQANYTDPTTGCQIDDKVFYGFQSTLTPGGTATTGSVGITVDPISTAFNPGLSFTLSGFSVTSNQSLDLKLGFNVQVLPGGALIEDASLGIAGAAFTGTGLVSIGENVCAGAAFGNVGAGTNCPAGDQNLSLNVANPGPPATFFDMKFTQSTTACPGGLCSLVGVFKDVSVTGGSSGSASLSSFTQQFSEAQVPEVGSIFLLGTSLLITSITIRRKRAKS